MKVTTAVIGSVLALVAMSCSRKSDATGTAFAPEQIRRAIADHVQQASAGGVYEVQDPAGGPTLRLRFDHVHAGVHDGPDGSSYACVDFRDPSTGDLYDADVYVKPISPSGPLVFHKFVLHKKNGAKIE